MTVSLRAYPDPQTGGTAEVVGSSSVEAAPGSTVRFSVRAKPRDGWFFVVWGAGAASVVPQAEMDAEVVYTVPREASRDLSLVAYAYFGNQPGGDDFPPHYRHGTIELKAAPNNAAFGSVTPENKVSRYGRTPPQRFSQRLTATPAYGYRFAYWTLNGYQLDTDEYPSSFTYSSPFPIDDGISRVSFVAYFEPVEVSVTLTTTPSPAGLGRTSPTYETKVVRFGESPDFQLSAVPFDGARFVGWSDGSGSYMSRNSSYRYGEKIRTVDPVVIQLTGHFDTYPPGPTPPSPPGPGTGLSAVDISTYVSPDEAAQFGATASPVFERHVGPYGSSASITISASPARVTSGGETYNFDHWEDGDGNIVSRNLSYSFTKPYPPEGIDSYGYTAVYVKADPRAGYRSILVFAGANKSSHTMSIPDGGLAFCGYGSISGGVSLDGDRYGVPKSGYVNAQSYATEYDEDSGSWKYADIPFAEITASDPDNGSCVFSRWEATTGQLTGEWTLVTNDRTLTTDHLKSALPNAYDGWIFWNDSESGGQLSAIKVRAVFEIKRKVIITSNAKCSRHDDDGNVLDEQAFNGKGYESKYLARGESYTVPFVSSDNFTQDPPAMMVHKEYDIDISVRGHYSARGFSSGKKYSSLTFTAPDDVSDFVLNGTDNDQDDDHNGWELLGVVISYRTLTGLPIADYDPDYDPDSGEGGEGSGELLHDLYGRLICDDSPCS